MGYIKHEAAIATTSSHRKGGLPDIEAFRATPPEEFRHLVVGPVASVTNGYFTYLFLPDGSKQGWDTDEEADDYRAAFIALFDDMYSDGSSADDVVSLVAYGGDYDHDNDGPSVCDPRRAVVGDVVVGELAGAREIGQ